MALITIFTVPKSFKHPHINMIQRNTARNLASLGVEVNAMLIGDDEGVAEVAAEYGVRHIPNVERNAQGTPIVASAFRLARENSDTPLLACINADNLVLPDLIAAARLVSEKFKNFLLVGQRYELDITNLIDFGPGWAEYLRKEILEKSRPLGPLALEYMIFPRDQYMDMPPFAFGRSAWDNWVAFKTRWERWPMVDATSEIVFGHQNHDYSHLPGNKPPYRLPESLNNIRMGGGRRTIFTLSDSTHVLRDGEVLPRPLTWQGLARSIETFPLLYLRSFALAEVTYALFHPRLAYGEWRGRILHKLESLRKRG
jgi:hypothetical protein